MATIFKTQLVTKNQEIRQAAKARLNPPHELENEYEDSVWFESRGASFVDEIIEISKQFPDETIRTSVITSSYMFLRSFNYDVVNGEAKRLEDRFYVHLSDKVKWMIDKLYFSFENQKKHLSVKFKIEPVRLY